MKDVIEYSREWYEETGQMEPSIEELQQWEWERGGCWTTAGCCFVECDGECSHGYKSWMLDMGLI